MSQYSGLQDPSEDLARPKEIIAGHWNLIASPTNYDWMDVVDIG